MRIPQTVLITAVSLVLGLGGFAAARWSLAPSRRTHHEPSLEARARSSSRPPPPAAAEPALRESKPARERMKEAITGDDPFASAARVVAWLESATLADFRAWAEEPATFPRMYFSGFDHAFREAFHTAVAERWFALDPEALAGMQRVRDSQEGDDRWDLDGLLRAAARLRPALVLETVPLATKQGWLEPFAHAAFRQLGLRSEPEARRAANNIADPKLRRLAEDAIAYGVAERDPLAAVALSRTAGERGATILQGALAAAERFGTGMVRQVFAAAEGRLDASTELPRLLMKDPSLASEIADPAKLKSTTWLSEDLVKEADLATPEERARLLARYDQLPRGARDNLCAALAGAWARTEPRAAAEWALAHAKTADADAGANQPAQRVFTRWMGTEREAALAWWRALPESPLRDALGAEASTHLAEDGDLAAALAVYRPLPGEAHRAATTQLAQFLAEEDPATAAAWLADLPPAAAPKEAAQFVIAEWMARDSDAAARWMETLPAGPLRDESLSVFINAAAQRARRMQRNGWRASPIRSCASRRHGRSFGGCTWTIPRPLDPGWARCRAWRNAGASGSCGGRNERAAPRTDRRGARGLRRGRAVAER